ncbi:MAG: DUF3328 domain-containing protein, partial [Thermoplasmata archaeon]|nr:DUF3328 domain-containing protein [Thermoplasmata archaeon]
DVNYVIVNTTYSVAYEATDDHTAVIDLTWAWTSNAAWLNFNATSQILSGTPSENDVGQYWVNISVSDEGGLSTHHNFTITVSTVAPNHAPGLSNSKISPTSGDTDTDFTFTVTYDDEDNDSGNVYIWIDGEQFKMTPDPTDNDYTDGVDYTYQAKFGEGEHRYYFTADDGELDAVPTDSTPTSSTNAGTTPLITETKADKKEAGDENWWIWVLLTFIIMLILVMVAFAMGRRMGAQQARPYAPPPEEAPAEEAAPDEGEEFEEWDEAAEEPDAEEPGAEEDEEWEGEEPGDLEKEAADEEMDEEMEEEDWDDEAKDKDEDIAEDETEAEAEEDWDEE